MEIVKTLFIEPYDGGSHRAFREGLSSHSRHQFESLTLPHKLPLDSFRVYWALGEVPSVFFLLVRLLAPHCAVSRHAPASPCGERGSRAAAGHDPIASVLPTQTGKAFGHTPIASPGRNVGLGALQCLFYVGWFRRLT